MYFWRIDKLKKSLSEKRPSQSDVFRYYLGLTIITVLISDLPVESDSNTSYKWISWGVLILSSLIVFIGSYIANGRDQGVDFLERIISISFVVTIRYIVFSFLAGIFIGIISGEGEVDFEKNILLLEIFVSFLMTYKVITHIKEISYSQNNYSE